MIGGSGKGKLGSLITPNKDEKSVEMFGRKREKGRRERSERRERKERREREEWGKGTEREEGGNHQRKGERR